MHPRDLLLPQGSYVKVNGAVVGLFFKEFLVPIFWIFKSLVQKDHRLVFQFVLKQHGISPDQVKFKPG